MCGSCLWCCTTNQCGEQPKTASLTTSTAICSLAACAILVFVVEHVVEGGNERDVVQGMVGNLRRTCQQDTSVVWRLLPLKGYVSWPSKSRRSVQAGSVVFGIGEMSYGARSCSCRYCRTVLRSEDEKSLTVLR